MPDRTDLSPILSRHPSWAENVSIGPEAIDYTWDRAPMPVDHKDAAVRRRTEKRHPLPSAHSPAQALCTSWSMADDR